MPDSDDRYSEEEFALILRKAAELQASASPGTGSSGIGVDEIKQIAAEVGIGAAFVDQAVSLARGSGDSNRPGFWGPAGKLQYKQTIQGRISDEDVGRLVDVIRDVMGEQGDVEEVLDSVQWSSGPNSTRRTEIGLTRRGDETRIQVRGDQRSVTFLSYFLPGLAGIITTAGVAGGVAQSPGAVVAMVAAGLAASYLAGRAIFTGTARPFQAKLERLTERLTRSASDLAIAAGAPAEDADDSE